MGREEALAVRVLSLKALNLFFSLLFSPSRKHTTREEWMLFAEEAFVESSRRTEDIPRCMMNDRLVSSLSCCHAQVELTENFARCVVRAK